MEFILSFRFWQNLGVGTWGSNKFRKIVSGNNNSLEIKKVSGSYTEVSPHYTRLYAENKTLDCPSRLILKSNTVEKSRSRKFIIPLVCKKAKDIGRSQCS